MRESHRYTADLTLWDLRKMLFRTAVFVLAHVAFVATAVVIGLSSQTGGQIVASIAR